MTRATTFLSILLVLEAGLAAGQHRAESEMAVKRVISECAEAWNRGDAGAAGQRFTEDADFVAADGTAVKGRTEIEAYHARLKAAGETLAWKPGGVRFLRPDVAVARASTEAASRDGRRRRAGPATVTLTKLGGQWLIAALQETPGGGSAPAAAAAATADAAPELTALLKEFLAGASRDDAATHERFWAEELVYTGSAGRRIGKPDILKDVRAPATGTPPPPTTYTAEDIRIQQFGDTAVVAFRLVGTTPRGATAQVRAFLNTGTFRRRDGKWQAVAWQATRMPRAKDEATREVAGADAAFHRALLAGDVKALEAAVHEAFVWTHRTGERMTRQQLVDALASGRLRYTKLDTTDVNVAVHGATAVVRGRWQALRSAFPGGAPGGDREPLAAVYTLTLADEGEGWKAVALHSNRPDDR